MKIFFYMGREKRNKSGVAWKMWKIQRSGKTVTVFWGPVRLVWNRKLRNRKAKPVGTLQSKPYRFRSADEAQDFEARMIRSKLNKGYERRTRSRSV